MPSLSNVDLTFESKLTAKGFQYRNTRDRATRGIWQGGGGCSVEMSSIELRTMRDDSRVSGRSSSPFESQRVVQRAISTTRRRILVVLVLIMCITAVTLTRFPGFVEHYTHLQGKVVAKTDEMIEMITVPLQPKQEVLNGEHQFYMLPKSHFKIPVGILIVLHPCKRSGLDFFLLPEDRIVAKDALNQGLAVLSLTSKDRNSGCFTSEDTPVVSQIVDQWTKLHNLQNIPRYGLGISSGGSFLFFVYRTLKLDSMVVYNTPQRFLPDDMDDHAMIPTAFVTMSMDKRMNKRMRESHRELSHAKVPTELFQISPRPFTKAICTSRLPEMLPKDCDRIFDTLRDDFSRILDKDGFVIDDVVSSEDWNSFASALQLDTWYNPLHFQTAKTSAGHSWPYASIEQEFRTCYARHAMSSEHHAKIIEFLVTAPSRVVDLVDGP